MIWLRRIAERWCLRCLGRAFLENRTGKFDRTSCPDCGGTGRTALTFIPRRRA